MVNLNTILVKSLQDVDGYYKQSDFIIDEEEERIISIGNDFTMKMLELLSFKIKDNGI